MSDERLWAPWRMEYLNAGGAKSADVDQFVEPAAWREGADRKCFLCRAAASYEAIESQDRRLLVIERGAAAFGLLNRYPYNNGHALVAPLRHVGEFDELSAAEHAECIELIGRLIRVYRRRLNADGFNVGLNLGVAAGAGVPGHLHWHVVPRWSGDHNFMPVVGSTRVIPQSLEAVWELLTEELRSNRGQASVQSR